MQNTGRLVHEGGSLHSWHKMVREENLSTLMSAHDDYGFRVQ